MTYLISLMGGVCSFNVYDPYYIIDGGGVCSFNVMTHVISLMGGGGSVALTL